MRSQKFEFIEDDRPKNPEPAKIICSAVKYHFRFLIFDLAMTYGDRGLGYGATVAFFA
ncbi:hypothetical protein QUA82_22060 [Microcoleus sp. F8-D3]